jgi:hypothetical protein
MAVVFTKEVEALFASPEAEKMHIIDVDHFLETFEDEEDFTIKIWDVVATVIFRMSPQVLSRFIDPNTMSFKLTINPNKEGYCKRIIWRRGNKLMVSQPPRTFICINLTKSQVGAYTPTELHGGHVYLWDNLVRCEINSNGAWEIVSASYGAMTRQIMDDIWDVNRIERGPNRFTEPQDDYRKQELAQILGTGMLLRGPWKQTHNQYIIKLEEKDNITWTAKSATTSAGA